MDYLHKKLIYPGYPPDTTPGWTYADGVLLPLPGDIYILCKGATRSKEAGGSHVGVVYDTNWGNSGGAQWRTADWGQRPPLIAGKPKGIAASWNGDLKIRTYDAGTGTLAGEGNAPTPKAVKGWVDLEKLAATIGKA